MISFRDYVLLQELSNVALQRAIAKFISAGIDKEEVEKYVNEFNTLQTKNKLKGYDIFKLDFEEIKNLVDSLKGQKSSKEVRQVFKKDTETVFENELVKVVVPLSHKSSCFYGSGTKWCTAGKDPTHFDTYFQKGIKLYYILPKVGEKVAVAVYMDGKREIFDDADKSQDKSWLTQKLKKYKIPITIFQSLTQDEHQKRLYKQLEQYDVEVYDGNIDISEKGLTKLPFKNLKKVTGHFYCPNNNLTTLEGAPESVGGYFYCYYNNLTTLEGAPKSVGGSFGCSNNNLTTLEGAPKSVGESFECAYNNLTTLEGAPKSVGGYFDCRNNKVSFTREDVKRVCKVKGEIIV
jgi:uncharacterized protein YlbG (UPF0298 family)